ncbi:MAG: 4Fe-4S cluster-binding domain-containing protein [Erysipelotrichaceae bacterium]|nr:4Fe-4S cluster-binding domain-containing protein [Erysipelotrichaceae bacterium]
MHQSYLIKPASSLCNMNCQYCFYKDVSDNRDINIYGIMSIETMKEIIDQSLSQSNEITYAFQGGEPTLAGLSFFQTFVDNVNTNKDKQIIHYSIQTNGILINEEWLSFFKKYHFLVGISIDGYKENHNKVRIMQKKKALI